jgi:hypothetical protein
VDAIPWYRSPVFVSLLVSVIMQAAVTFHLSTALAEADVAKFVDLVLQIVAIGAAGFAGFKRYRSNIQPLAVSKPSADAKSLPPQCHPFAIALAGLFAMALMGGCAQLGVQAAQTVEQKAAALLGDFTIFQKASLKIGEDPTVPSNIRKEVLDAPIAMKPAVDSLDEALRTYREIELQLKAGQTTDEKLRIASQNLLIWVNRLAPQVKALRTTIEGARP